MSDADATLLLASLMGLGLVVAARAVARAVERGGPTPRERLERAACAVLGHRWVLGEAPPVVGPHHVCLRCGRWFRRTSPREPMPDAVPQRDADTQRSSSLGWAVDGGEWEHERRQRRSGLYSQPGPW